MKLMMNLIAAGIAALVGVLAVRMYKGQMKKRKPLTCFLAGAILNLVHIEVSP